MPADWEDYKAWVASLPKDDQGEPIFPDPTGWYHGYKGQRQWVNTPFLCYLFYIDDEITDEEILDQAEAHAKIAYAQWARGTKIKMFDNNNNTVKPLQMTPQREMICNAKLQHIQETILEQVDIKPLAMKRKL